LRFAAFIALITMKRQKATMRKLMILSMKVPYRITEAPAAWAAARLS
jgi:hypothetical protein